ncbi:5-formyltetrahydrofolate cyclo-ligase [Carboxylicivirga marina]|uniref:5-formyltetrahydrofolate cyclo-ligase n=1 Tax=Carboxylicivirga marina TaxID=2800988 RepID=UPI001F43C29B|nr:5-formyltetrahydrofolate cyclo-ligase [Carboxylicivirga marina]
MIEQKRALRKQIKELKSQLSADERKRQTEIIHSKLESSEAFCNASSVLLYWALPDEVGTERLIEKWHSSKEIYLPVIHGDDLKIVRYTGKDSLVAGDKYGIPEPNGPEIDDESRIELVIVPGVAFDGDNNRMGRGAGYYDRILKRIPEATKTALAYSFQMVSKVPVEAHDIKMNMVISP